MERGEWKDVRAGTWIGAGARWVNASMWTRRRGIIGVDWPGLDRSREMEERWKPARVSPGAGMVGIGRTHRRGQGHGDAEGCGRIGWEGSGKDGMACRRVRKG